MLLAFFSVLGIVVGASLQYLFTSFLEERKHQTSLKTAAYSDYIRAVAESAHLNLSRDEAKLQARLADAKTRICLYGSPEVVDRLAQFESCGAVIANDQQLEAFMAVIQAMRGHSKLQAPQLELILLGKSR
jgi:hypothetical protein